MRDWLVLMAHLIVTIIRIMAPGGARTVIAESLLLKHQLLILNRSRKRAPKLRALEDHYGAQSQQRAAAARAAGRFRSEIAPINVRMKVASPDGPRCRSAATSRRWSSLGHWRVTSMGPSQRFAERSSVARAPKCRRRYVRPSTELLSRCLYSHVIRAVLLRRFRSRRCSVTSHIQSRENPK
jgi:hypothetical protein